MPTVKTYTVHFPQPSGARDFKVRVNVGSGGLFSIKLPEGVEPVLGFDEVTAKTLNDVESAFRRALEQFREARSVRRKVIYYRVGMTAYIIDAKQEECVLSRSDVSFANGAALCIYAGVFEEEEIAAADGSKRYNYKELESSIPNFLTRGQHSSAPGSQGGRANNLLDWTPERETFFAKIGAGLAGLMLQLDGAFKSKASVQKLADSGGKLLLG